MRTRTKKGFTLVEILIVVVILGILAAIVIPQFTNASTEAKESSLVSNIQALRSQVELYKIQHNETLPGSYLAVGFVEALTSKTNAAGEVGSTSTHRYGPYMQKVPANPFSLIALDVDGNGTVQEEAGVTGLGGDSAHWHFDIDTGTLRADDDGENAVTSIDHIDM